MEFRKAERSELCQVAKLYCHARQTPYCVWDETYPTLEHAENDFMFGGLYVLMVEDRVIGAVSVIPENELDDYGQWHFSKGACEIARVVVDTPYRGNGYAAEMIQRLTELLRTQGVLAIHLSAQRDHLPANRTYRKLGFTAVGEAELYGSFYTLYELPLQVNGDGGNGNGEQL